MRGDLGDSSTPPYLTLPLVEISLPGGSEKVNRPFGSVWQELSVALAVFADGAAIIFVFLEFHFARFKMKFLDTTGNDLFFFQDMAVSNDLELLLFVVISDLSAREGVAVQIIKIGILLLQFAPKLIVLARVRPDCAGNFDSIKGSCFGKDASVDQVEDANLRVFHTLALQIVSANPLREQIRGILCPA
jgi:hypothetical protein